MNIDVTGNAADVIHENEPEQPDVIRQDRLWKEDGWTAKVIKNEDDEGWAVAMIKDGEPEPALVGPWTMGRDKKNPKPLSSSAFITLVKTASEFVRRHEQQLYATLHKSFVVSKGSQRVTVNLDIVPDDENPYATLTALSESNETLAQKKVAPAFNLTRASALQWVEAGFA